MTARKRYLIRPEKVYPKDWPTCWEFPSNICPPGYPRPGPEKLFLSAQYEDGTLSVRVLNEYGEDVDELNGYFLKVQGLAGGVVIRMREPDSSKWFEAGVFLVNNGVSVPLEFEVSRVKQYNYFINIGLYGVDERFGTCIEVRNASLPS